MDEQSLTRQYRGLVKFYVAGISASVPRWSDRDDLTSAGRWAYRPCVALTPTVQ
jgi:hypothetical protein